MSQSSSPEQSNAKSRSSNIFLFLCMMAVLWISQLPMIWAVNRIQSPVEETNSMIEDLKKELDKLREPLGR
jgi:flagellar biogenesis protein FliO